LTDCITSLPRDPFTISASPGFTWGKSGSVSNTYLLNDTVPGNTAGRLSPVDGFITTIFVSCEIATSTVIEIQRRTAGPTFTILATVTLSAERKKTVLLAVQPAVAKNDELMIKVTGPSIKNPVIGLIIKGTL